MPRLSVVIPVYNERSTLEEIVGRVLAVPIDKEIILVDDGSTNHQLYESQPLTPDTEKTLYLHNRSSFPQYHLHFCALLFKHETCQRLQQYAWLALLF